MSSVKTHTGQIVRVGRRGRGGGGETHWELAVTEETIAPTLFGYVEIWRYNDNNVMAATGERVIAFGTSLPAYYTLPVGVRVRIEWHGDSNRWFITGVYQ